jgi:hypothetical protein
MIFKHLTSRGTHSYQHNLGPLKSCFRRGPMSPKAARSVIGNWRIKTWPRQKTSMACMKSLTRLDPSSRRPWVRAATLISIAAPPGKLESRRANSPQKISSDHALGTRSSALKIGFHRIRRARSSQSCGAHCTRSSNNGRSKPKLNFMLGDFIVGFGGLACSAWRLVALCRWPPHPKTALLIATGPRPCFGGHGPPVNKAQRSTSLPK